MTAKPAKPAPHPAARPWRLLVAALSILVLLSAVVPENAGVTVADEPAQVAAPIQLVVDFGDGVEKHFTAIPWQADMTVLDVMEAASKHPRGIRFEYRGRGETALLTQIDGLKNEGRGSNWIYRVNGELGDSSFAIRKLHAGDAVLWKFGSYR